MLPISNVSDRRTKYGLICVLLYQWENKIYLFTWLIDYRNVVLSEVISWEVVFVEQVFGQKLFFPDGTTCNIYTLSGIISDSKPDLQSIQNGSQIRLIPMRDIGSGFLWGPGSWIHIPNTKINFFPNKLFIFKRKSEFHLLWYIHEIIKLIKTI